MRAKKQDISNSILYLVNPVTYDNDCSIVMIQILFEGKKTPWP